MQEEQVTGRDLESQERAEDEGDREGEMNTAPDSDTVADTQDEEVSTGGVKRKQSDISPAMKIKRRKT